ncbi:1-acyl-sn-glycerol-3-phosphate acyltransferase [Nocardioides gansuensis]|uniref:1-acyl-sn-glycerol-3-phosphate acyltransferase n=1 Tax=Nocardioides gansuensis TaxID=2138300 RepID=A0A2T8FA64_9ACTN|nr:lysophospholipid acyltransferase family protein [Nocardioides gansuensis]PVG82616.1 1-acyl-sn-glycerol-3-phosphate acyltransferase [Nocardioides gansuensis]
MRVRKLEGRRGWAFTLGAAIVKPAAWAVTRYTWIDGEKIPPTGGCIVVANHISHLDPFLVAHFVYDHGRLPRYLAKSSVFRNKALAGFLRSAGQIPVERLTRSAIGAYDAAVEAVHDGECVVVYPEGTLTRDPDLWPMAGKSGAARIALATGCPVIPLGHWGAQELLYPYASKPRLFPRKHIVMKAGDPVPLDDLRAAPLTAETVTAATERIMTALTDIVTELRGETPPAQRFDPRKAGVKPIGNPNKRNKKDAK